jgi:phospholipase A1/A2
MIRSLLFTAILGLSPQLLFAQNIDSESIKKSIFQTPAFSVFKTNYVVVGTAIGEKPVESNTNSKMQISFKYRVTDTVLPFQTYLYCTYTQKIIWRVLANSFPYAETNFHPTVGLGKMIYYKNRFRGIAAITLEHESNGRDSAKSRSWNRIVANYILPYSATATWTFRAWLPVKVESKNADIVKYVGYGEASFHYVSPNKRLFIDITGRKGWAWDGRGFVQAQLSYRPFRKANPYLTLQWFKGFAETLETYDKSVHRIYLGAAIKPTSLFSEK